MKNFRKVLALVLVVATLFSFAAMASAAGYKDAADVSETYAQAVDVLSAVGVLNGYEDGSFKPTADISREEMAKMIAVLANAGDDVSKLYATACTFADVAKDRWSASYVAYCAKTGIVAGRSASTFDPYGKVTGLETAKMLLVVLGFSAEEQGYIGADWKVNVLRDAKNMGLLNGFAAGYDVDAAISRQEAAHMMLNALTTKVVVGVLSNNVIKVTNAVYNYLNGTLIDANKDGKIVNLYGNVLVSNTTLFEALYGGALTQKTTGERDCYGRPATVWTLTINGKTSTIGTYPATPVWTSHNTSASEVAGVLSNYASSYTKTYYTDGYPTTASGMTYGKGAEVEIYAVGTELTVVEKNTYVAYIKSVNTAKHTFDLTNYTGNQVGYDYANEFGLTTADEGKIVLYWICAERKAGTYTGNKLHDLKIAEPVTATVTSAKTYKGQPALSSFVADGKTYEYAEKFNTLVLGADTTIIGENNDAQNYVGDSLDIYLDEFGYVMWFEPTDDVEYSVSVLVNSSAKQYLEYTTNVGNKNVYSYTAQFVEFGANPVVGEAIAVTKNTYNNDKSSKGSDTLVMYTGEKRDVVARGDYTTNVTLGASANVGLPGLAATNNTQYLLRVYNYLTGKYEYKYFNGKSELDATYKLDTMQYFASGNALTYVYGEAKYAEASNYAFILSYDCSEIWLTEGGKKVAYNAYKALVNGEEAVVAYTNDFVIPDNLANTYRVWKAELECIGMTTLDGQPIYVVKSTPELDKANGNSFKVLDGAIVWGTDVADLAEDAKIIVAFPGAWDSDADGVVDMKYIALDKLSDLNTYAERYGWDQGYAWYKTTNGEISLMYVCVTVDPAQDVNGGNN